MKPPATPETSATPRMPLRAGRRGLATAGAAAAAHERIDQGGLRGRIILNFDKEQAS